MTAFKEQNLSMMYTFLKQPLASNYHLMIEETKSAMLKNIKAPRICYFFVKSLCLDFIALSCTQGSDYIISDGQDTCIPRLSLLSHHCGELYYIIYDMIFFIFEV